MITKIIIHPNITSCFFFSILKSKGCFQIYLHDTYFVDFGYCPRSGTNFSWISTMDSCHTSLMNKPSLWDYPIFVDFVVHSSYVSLSHYSYGKATFETDFIGNTKFRMGEKHTNYIQRQMHFVWYLMTLFMKLNFILSMLQRWCIVSNTAPKQNRLVSFCLGC